MNVIILCRVTFLETVIQVHPGRCLIQLTTEPLMFPLALSRAPAPFFITASI